MMSRISLQKVKHFAALVKIEHTVFALPFALVGYFLALYSGYNQFHWLDLGLIILAVLFARNAAMAFNRWADRAFDEKNSRTAKREIPRGAISANAALLFVVINALLFVAVAWFFNTLCFLLSPIALFVVLGYSYTKRFSSWCHLFLGLGLAIAPTGAYLAVAGSFAPAPILLSVAVLFWTAGFDIIYALNDQNFDKKSGLHSIPQYFGTVKALQISSLFHSISALVLILCGLLIPQILGLSYWLGTTAFILLLIHQHRIVKPNDLSRIGAAFFTTNGVASLIFASVVILGLILDHSSSNFQLLNFYHLQIGLL